MRIVSVVPSQTELLYALGITPVGQTIFCIHPDQYFKEATKIGGTKKLNIPKIKALKPDLILANKEENEKSQIETLEKECKVWMSDIVEFGDAIHMISQVGLLTGRSPEAEVINGKIQEKFQALRSLIAGNRPRVLYLIWKNPFMAAGHHTFINSMLREAGFVNALPTAFKRYPELDTDAIKAIKPDFIFLSSEPYPFKESHITEMEKEFPQTKIRIVDGEMFSWYGNRMTLAADYFVQLQQELRR